MNFLKRLAEMREANTAATQSTNRVLEQADKDHETALEMDRRVTEQASRLTSANHRNHYSESLTHAFRGSTA
jgi:hypothetical protein